MDDVGRVLDRYLAEVTLVTGSLLALFARRCFRPVPPPAGALTLKIGVAEPDVGLCPSVKGMPLLEAEDVLDSVVSLMPLTLSWGTPLVPLTSLSYLI